MLQQNNWEDFTPSYDIEQESDYSILRNPYEEENELESLEIEEKSALTFGKVIKKLLFFIFMMFFTGGLCGGVVFTVGIAMYVGMMAYSTRNPIIYGTYFVVMSVVFFGLIFLIIYEVRKNAKRKRKMVARQTRVPYPYRTDISRSQPGRQWNGQGPHSYR